MAPEKQTFKAQEMKVARLAKALGHPARLAIVAHLARVNACICGDIVDVLPLAQSTVSQHLKALKEAGVIRGSVEGNSVCYCLDPTALIVLKEFLSQLTDLALTQNNCC